MARKLRIAVSVFFGVLSVAMCVLWIWSRWSRDTVFLIHPLSSFIVTSQAGGLWISHFQDSSYRPFFSWASQPSESPLIWGFVEPEVGIWFPYWLLTLFSAAAATLPWSRRFSIRTLLIATTLMAVVLGLVVWVGR